MTNKVSATLSTFAIVGLFVIVGAQNERILKLEELTEEYQLCRLIKDKPTEIIQGCLKNTQEQDNAQR